MGSLRFLQEGTVEPDNFEVLEGILRCAAPWTESQIHWLYKHGIRSIISLERLDEGLLSAIRSRGMRHLVLEVPDMGEPSMHQVERFLEFIEEDRAAHRPVAIHCALGKGRTGTMYALWLVSRGMEPEAAIRQAATLETEAQKDFVREFGAHLWPIDRAGELSSTSDG
jgi:atypical dual specificity phosphatase